MLWVELFNGTTVMLECDNTAAVSWLLKHRSKKGGPADVLVKLYTLFILRNKITVLGKHIKGLDNVDADTNSRNLLLAKQAADENVAGTLGGIYSSEQTREMRCRTLLMRCVTQPDKMRGQALVKELMLLDGSHGAYA